MLFLLLLGHRALGAEALGAAAVEDRAGRRNKEEKKCSSSWDTQCREIQTTAENLKQSLAAPWVIDVMVEGTAEALSLSWVQ